MALLKHSIYSRKISNLHRFDDDYSIGEHLGSGKYATVQQCESRSDGKTYAVKIVNKSNLGWKEKEVIKREIKILESLQHPHILSLHSKYEDKKNLYLVTEFMAGGDLLKRIVKKKRYNDKEAAETCKIILNAIKHCHDHEIVHRDIKPENILFTSKDNDTDLKIADFGFATKVRGENRTTFCGTPSYIAPEIVKKMFYGVKVDMWSIGVITYTLLAGYFPFDEEGDDLVTLFKKIEKGNFKFHEKYWKHVSEDAKDLVSKLIKVKPSQRLSAKEALHSKWLLEDKDVLSTASLSDCQVSSRNPNTKKKFHGVAVPAA